MTSNIDTIFAENNNSKVAQIITDASITTYLYINTIYCMFTYDQTYPIVNNYQPYIILFIYLSFVLRTFRLNNH